MFAKRVLLAGLAVAGLATTSVPAMAKQSQFGPPLASTDCFRSRDWEGSWKAVDDKTAYFTANHKIYKISVLADAQYVETPNRFIVSRIRGSDMVCRAQDLDLKVADRSTGAVIPLFPVALARLTDAEVAALPAKDRPR